MQKIFVAAIVAVAGTAYGQDYLVKKTTGGGFQLPAIAESETCEIYEGKAPGYYRVEITRTFGNITSTYSESLQVENLEDAIQNASLEPLVNTPNNICDAPETVYSAQLPGVLAEYTIFKTGACGSDELDRQGANSSNIKNLVDQFCPWTIDFNLPSLQPRGL